MTETTYAIKETPHYQRSTSNAPQEALLTYRDVSIDDDIDCPQGYRPDDIATYTTAEEAQAVIDRLDGGRYTLDHGEVDRPTYTIVDRDYPYDGPDCYDAASIISDTDMPGMTTTTELPDDILDKLHSLNVEYHSSGPDYDIYAAETTVNGKTYGIAYCPKTVALQVCADDLSRLNWAKPAYLVEA